MGYAMQLPKPEKLKRKQKQGRIGDREQARWHPERRWRQLAELKSAHRDLDDVIAHIGETARFDQIQVKRLKKRKLMLKDQIAQIESRLLPDIIA